jgi:hypothetical protein
VKNNFAGFSWLNVGVLADDVTHILWLKHVPYCVSCDCHELVYLEDIVHDYTRLASHAKLMADEVSQGPCCFQSWVGSCSLIHAKFTLTCRIHTSFSSTVVDANILFWIVRCVFGTCQELRILLILLNSLQCYQGISNPADNQHSRQLNDQSHARPTQCAVKVLLICQSSIL